MNVVVVIDGREAIPLRAVPYLSGWQGMTPDALATALLGHEVFFQFEGLLAYSKEGETIKAVRPREWEDIVLAMTATDDRIKDREVSHSDGRDQARRECLRLLPAGWFVWKDEFEPMYRKKYERVPHFSMSTGEQIEPKKRKELVELDFAPFIQDQEIRDMVMAGFEHQQSAPEPLGVPGDVPVERIRYEILASRTELIEAFHYYGVEMKIFKCLKDRPGLYAAYRIKGKGQKGKVTEPMFCPFEVMNWLVNKGIKGQRRLEGFMGWHILETKFPNVYAEKSIGDPRLR